MFCMQCGAKNPDDAIFCQKCGKRTETTNQDETRRSSSLPTPPVGTSGSLSYERQDDYMSPSIPYQPPIATPPSAALPLSSPTDSPYTAYGSAGPSYTSPPSSAHPNDGRPGPYGLPPSPFLAQPPQKSRRNLLIVLGIVGAVILLVIAFSVFSYANRSTPTKTLQTFCNAAKSGDFQTAYNQLDPAVLSNQTEQAFASSAVQGLNTVGGLTSCTVGSVTESGSSATGVITFTYGNGKSFTGIDTLTNENGVWKITKESSG